MPNQDVICKFSDSVEEPLNFCFAGNGSLCKVPDCYSTLHPDLIFINIWVRSEKSEAMRNYCILCQLHPERQFSSAFIFLKKAVKAPSPAETRWEVLAKEAADCCQDYCPVQPRVQKHNMRMIQPSETALPWAKML